MTNMSALMAMIVLIPLGTCVGMGLVWLVVHEVHEHRAQRRRIAVIQAQVEQVTRHRARR